MNETEYIAAINELDAQCEEDDDIHSEWVNRGKSRRVRRKQASTKHRKLTSFTANSKRHDPENFMWDRMWRPPHPQQTPAKLLTNWTDSEPEDREHADDKRMLRGWSDNVIRDNAWQDELSEAMNETADEQLRENAG